MVSEKFSAFSMNIRERRTLLVNHEVIISCERSRYSAHGSLFMEIYMRRGRYLKAIATAIIGNL